ncbi:lonely Cys domain-containing protein [Streptomyces sp. FXJ1.4098]|nr:lonely Cys domain-containing protein [Streptomyces sp. FXJ1.4098]
MLDRLARVAFGIPASAPVPEADRDNTLLLVRALREVFGHEVENGRDDPSGEYQKLLRGIGALEVMRRDDPGLAEAGPFSLDLLDFVVRAHLEQRGTPKPRPAAFADSTELRSAVRQVLDDARGRLQGAPGPVALRDFVPLTVLDQTAAMMGLLPPQSLGAMGLKALPAPGQPSRSLVFWALAKAGPALMNHPDPDALAARILHVEGAPSNPDAMRQMALWLMAGAALIGVDVYDPVALAAHHLRRSGLLSPATAITSPAGQTTGLNLTGKPLGGPLNTDVYRVSPDGTTGSGESRTTQGPSSC